MTEHERRRREIDWSLCSLCEAPFREQSESEVEVRWARVDGADVIPEPYRDVRFRYELHDEGWVCTGLYLVAGELTATELTERFPFTQLEDTAAEAVVMITKTAPRVTAPRRRGRKGNSDEFLQQVAELYRYATAHPKHRRAPVAFIREQQDLWRQGFRPAEDTVRSWLRQARKRGLLGASIPGKAGERPPEGE
jgi:hypothetical protein